MWHKMQTADVLNLFVILIVWTCSGLLVPLLFAKSTIYNDEAYEGNEMFKITPREALAIQKRQILHYADLFPGKLPALEKAMADKTNLKGIDLDKEYDMVFINQRIPRGGDIEHLVLGKDYGGN